MCVVVVGRVDGLALFTAVLVRKFFDRRAPGYAAARHATGTLQDKAR